MVVATGDGGEAEYSDGFPANIARALNRGWKVELVAWKRSLSAEYRKFQRLLPDRFRIIELDEFLPHLVEYGDT
jgi:hypothetical protein